MSNLYKIYLSMFLIFAATAIFTTGLYALTQPSTLGLCYIEGNNITGNSYLRQNVEWGFDYNIGSFDNFDAARKAGEALGCKFN